MMMIGVHHQWGQNVPRVMKVLKIIPMMKMKATNHQLVPTVTAGSVIRARWTTACRDRRA